MWLPRRLVCAHLCAGVNSRLDWETGLPYLSNYCDITVSTPQLIQKEMAQWYRTQCAVVLDTLVCKC